MTTLVLPHIEQTERTPVKRARDSRRKYKRTHVESTKEQNRHDTARYRTLHQKELRDGHDAWKAKSPWVWLAKCARERATKLGIIYGIDPEYVRQIWPEDNRCPVTGLELKRSRGRMCDASPSLDRLDPERGYVRGNVAVISAKANRQKGDLNADGHRRMADWIDEQLRRRMGERD